MTNLANSPIFPEDMEMERVVVPKRPLVHDVRKIQEMHKTQKVQKAQKAQKAQKLQKTQRRIRALSLSAEDQEIVLALSMVKRDLEALHNRYDHTTDPILVDSIIYEMKAAHMKYTYYLHLCKEKGIVGGC